MFSLEQKSSATYQIPPEHGMLVPGLVIATPELMQEAEFLKTLDQVRNVAHLPGIVGHSIAMPDIHWGYGFPIGGVAATDIETGVISPGGVGYDINCGIRLAIVPIPFSELTEKTRDDLIEAIFNTIPSGVSKRQQKSKLTDDDYRQLLQQGARWAIDHDCGFPEDLEHIEDYGCLPDGHIGVISQRALERGRQQMGTLGSGNHFIEIGAVQQVFDDVTATSWNIKQGDTYILIHSGSRGFGHQICQDTINKFIKKQYADNLPDRQLVAAPLQHADGQEYLQAMAAAANFAFNNRQCMLHAIRQVFQQVLSIDPQDIKLVYDICHNIAKIEEHDHQRLCVHRKGATRALEPHNPLLPPIFHQTGQPVLVPGNMGSSSYVMAGRGNPLTWSSSCHGAGRKQSRTKARKEWQYRNPLKHMASQGIKLCSYSQQAVAEEMPSAYKEIDWVIEAVEQAHLATKVAKLKPSMVIKG